jgi:UDP-N-acetylmuramoyl-L-alanyl-D-glutamate--2,6-diaminopimelate ligase
MDKKLKTLFNNIEAGLPAEAADLIIREIQYDSRKIQSGDLFVAVRGFKTDGHQYLRDVQAKDAAAAVVEEKDEQLKIPQIVVKNCRETLPLLAYNYYELDSLNLKIIGITGTNGKTTASYLLRSIMEAAQLPAGVVGTIAYTYGATQKRAPNTTPESLDLYRMLSEMEENGLKSCVMEVSSHALSLNRVDGLKFDAALFTNLGRDHMDFYDSVEDYFSAKAKLFYQVKKDGAAVINYDDPYGQRLMEMIEGRAVTYGLNKEAQVTVLEKSMDIRGTKLLVRTSENSFEVRSKLIGEFNIYNILSAIAAAYAMDIPKEAIISGIGALEMVPGRMQSFEIKPGVLAIIDYAHAPEALKNALMTVREITEKRLIVVFGAGGDRDRGKRPLMGQIAEELADVAIVTSDNPRTEDPQAIINDVLSGMKLPEKRKVMADRRQAIAEAVKMAQQGDVVLVAGKGHESYQEINGVRRDFNEEKIIRESLNYV